MHGSRMAQGDIRRAGPAFCFLFGYQKPFDEAAAGHPAVKS